MTRPPTLVDPLADQRFRDLAIRTGLDPDARFVGGYVDWEWNHARHVFDGTVEPLQGRPVLEVGCNVGATAIVLAALGAEVTAIDPDPAWVVLARANAARFGQAIRIEHVSDTTRMPFASASFDWIACNSVLEYVVPDQRRSLLRELDRVLRSRGVLAILGTSNRLWPREQHSGRWWVNYLPRRIRPSLRRGVSARAIYRALPGYTDLIAADGGCLFLSLKKRMGVTGLRYATLRGVAALAAVVGLSPGSVGPTLTLLLRKP